MEGMTARQLETIRRKLSQEWRRKSIAGELTDDMEAQLKSKMDEINNAIKERLESERIAADPKRIKGVTEKIDTKTPYLKEVSGDEFKTKIANKRMAAKNLKKVGKGFGNKMKSMIPGLGIGLAALNVLSAPSAQAGEVAKEEAVQAATDLVPGGVDTLGPAEGTPESIVEDPSASPEMRRKALETLRNRNQ